MKQLRMSKLSLEPNRLLFTSRIQRHVSKKVSCAGHRRLQIRGKVEKYPFWLSTQYLQQQHGDVINGSIVCDLIINILSPFYSMNSGIRCIGLQPNAANVEGIAIENNCEKVDLLSGVYAFFSSYSPQHSFHGFILMDLCIFLAISVHDARLQHDAVSTTRSKLFTLPPQQDYQTESEEQR